MKIAMVASESRPFCKTGGLADVVYSLSKELVIMGEEVMVILPFYQAIKNTIKTIFYCSTEDILIYTIRLNYANIILILFLLINN